MSRAGDLFLATRPMFFPASTIPVVVGTAWGVHAEHDLDVMVLLLALIGMLCFHGAANVLNDVSDEINGCDRINDSCITPFTGGSRFIQDGRLNLRQMTAWGAALTFATVAVGMVLVALAGPMVLALGIVGIGLGLAYSFQPFALASRGLGELSVAVAFGMPVAACAWLQSAIFPPGALLAAVAVGAWTAAILVVNSIPDRRADAAAGKRTLVVLLGPDRARWLYVGIHAVAAAALAAAGLGAGHGPLAAVAFVLLIPAIAAAKRMVGDRDDVLAAIRLTLSIHLVGGMWLAGMTLL